MLQSLKDRFVSKLSRRELFRRGSLLALPALLPEKLVAAAAGTPKVRVGTDIYKSIGVRPLINCRGTFTIISGSTMLPEVRCRSYSDLLGFARGSGGIRRPRPTPSALCRRRAFVVRSGLPRRHALLDR